MSSHPFPLSEPGTCQKTAKVGSESVTIVPCTGIEKYSAHAPVSRCEADEEEESMLMRVRWAGVSSMLREVFGDSSVDRSVRF